MSNSKAASRVVDSSNTYSTHPFGGVIQIGPISMFSRFLQGVRVIVDQNNEYTFF